MEIVPLKTFIIFVKSEEAWRSQKPKAKSTKS